MNIYHQILIPIFFLLTISIDESVVHSGLLSKTPGSGSSESYEHLKKHLMNGKIYELSDKSGSKSNSEENGSNKHKVHFNKGSGSKSSDENSGSKSSDENSGSKSSVENSGSKNSKEESGKKKLNKKNGKKHFKEEKKSKNSHEKNGSENSHEKNGSENSLEKKVVAFSHEKNENENFNEQNGNVKNSKEKNTNKDDTDDDKFTVIMVNDSGNPEEEYENGIPFETNYDENSLVGKEIKSSTPMRYLSSVQAFNKAKISQYPYHVAIVWKPDGRLLCQGALIKPGWIITSASCIYQYKLHYKTLAVLMGIESLRDPAVVSRDILEVVIYPLFISDQSLNDLALIMLDSDVGINENLKLVAISKPYDPSERKCHFSTFIEDNLYGKSVEFVFQENCDVLEIEGQTLPYFCASINGSLIDSTKRSTYGSPLVCGGVIYGIKTKNTLFSSVDTVIPWINDVTQIMSKGNNT